MDFKKYLDFLQSIFGSVFNKRGGHGQPNLAHHHGAWGKKSKSAGTQKILRRYVSANNYNLRDLKSLEKAVSLNEYFLANHLFFANY